METKYQTSFIPKKPMTTTEPSHFGGMSILLLVSIIIFLLSLGLAGYVFLEKSVLVQKINSDLSTIKQNESGLVSNSDTIENLVQLDSRINVSKILLSKHVAISPIFNFLAQATLQSVRFTNFSFGSASNDSSGTGAVSVQMSGVAKDWETVASQADEFGRQDYKKVITEPKVSNLTLNADGSISFLFSATVSPSFLVYGSNVTNN